MPAPEPGPQATPPLRIPWRGLLVGGILTAVVYSIFLAISDARQLTNDLARVSAGAWSAALALALVGYALRGLRWRLFFRALGVPMDVARGVLTFTSGFALGVTPGKVGELVRIYYVRRYADAPYGTGWSVSVADRVLDAAAVGALFFAAYALLPVPGSQAAALLLATLAIAIWLLGARRPAQMVLGAIARLRPLRRLVVKLQEIHDGVRALLRPRYLAPGLALSLAGWGCEVVAVFLLADSMGLGLGPAAAAFVFMGASVAGVLSFLPGGVGATEGGMVALLLLLDVPLAAATALTLAARLATLWFSIVVGAAAILALRWVSPATPTLPSPEPS